VPSLNYQEAYEQLRAINYTVVRPITFRPGDNITITGYGIAVNGVYLEKLAVMTGLDENHCTRTPAVMKVPE